MLKIDAAVRFAPRLRRH